MDMCLGSTDALQVGPLRLPAAICEKAVHNLLNGRHENGRIVFRVPVEMQEDLMIGVR